MESIDEEEIDQNEQTEDNNETKQENALDGKQVAAQNRKKGTLRKSVQDFGKEVANAFRGNAKSIFVLKAKLIIFAVIAVLVFLALIVEGDALDISSSSNNAASSTFANSSSQGAELYNQTGSLALADEKEVEQIKDAFLEEIENSRPGFHEALNTVYSGKESSSVSNKVTQITTNYADGTTSTLPSVAGILQEVSGAASPKDSKTIYEHILNTEKYNFNNIIWRSFVKSGNKLVEQSINFQVDNGTKLKYPKKDANDLDNSSHTLTFFLDKVRPYLQSWHIPFDLIVGTQDAQEGKAVNTDLAYEIITSAYHEIVLDRYKLETLNKTTDYLIYDETTVKERYLRTCDYYTYQNEEKYYCIDTLSNELSKTELKDIKKEISNNEVKSYRWNYVVSQAKMFDRVISNEYKFTAYKQNQEDAYNYTQNTKDYYNETVTFSKNVYNANVVESIPEGAVKKQDKLGEQTYIDKTTVIQRGTEYIESYTWSDTLEFSKSLTGIYNVESVKEVTGDELTTNDTMYYTSLYNNEGLNLIDLMNSDKEIYDNYLNQDEMSSSTDNIGITRSKLSISYDVLKDDLTKLAQNYPISGLMYGSSLVEGSSGSSILGGLNLGNITVAGGVNEAMVQLASSFVGKDLNYMMSIDDTGTFAKDEWCAMFVSYCMRKIQKESGVKIPIPTFWGCSSFWRQYNTKPGFYDVETSTAPKTNSAANLAPLEGIQPGDIVLIRYSNENKYARNHTAIVKTVERDESGKVTSVTTIDGNWNGYDANGQWSCTLSHVTEVKHKLSTIATYVSISTVLSEAQKGNTW